MKRAAKKFLELFFGSDLVIGLYLKLRRPRPRILLYHGVSDRPEEQRAAGVFPAAQFEAQLKYLKKTYADLPLPRLLSGELSGNSVTLTFDDGYENNYSCAAPLLERYGFSAAVFVCPHLVEGRAVAWWHIFDYCLNDATRPRFRAVFERHGLAAGQARKTALENTLKDAPAGTYQKVVDELSREFSRELAAAGRPRFLSWPQIAELAGRGFTIGAHTATHVTVSRLSPADYEAELRRPKQLLEEKLGRSVEFFAFPYGERPHYSADSLAYLKQAGYRCALLALAPADPPESDPFCLDRVALDKNDSPALFRLKVSGLYRDAAALYRRFRRPR